MAAGKLKIKFLSAAVRVSNLDQSGKPKLQQVGWGSDAKPILEASTKLVFLPRGSELPEHIAHGELDRLKEMGALGTPEEVARYGDAVRSSAPEPEPVPDVTVEAADLANLASASDAQLAALYEGGKAPKVAELLAAVGQDAELAQRVLAAEQSATSGDPRPTLQSGLDKVITEASTAVAAPAGFAAMNANDAAKAVTGYDAAQLDAALAAENARTGTQAPRSTVISAIEKRQAALKETT